MCLLCNLCGADYYGGELITNRRVNSMRLNRFACLFFASAIFFGLTAAVSQCHAEPSSVIKKGNARPRQRAPYRRFSGFQLPTSSTLEPGHSDQFFSDSVPHLASPTIAPPMLQGAPNGYVEPPMLQGATNGTIGPPSTSVALPGVCIDGTQVPTKKAESPVLPTLLFASLSLSLIFVGVRSLVFKKRAPLFILGLIAAGALMLVGFMLSFYEPVTLAEAPQMQPVPVSLRSPNDFPPEVIKHINVPGPQFKTAAAAVAVPD